MWWRALTTLSTRGNSSTQIKGHRGTQRGILMVQFSMKKKNQTSFIYENQLSRLMDTLFHVPQLRASLWKKVWQTHVAINYVLKLMERNEYLIFNCWNYS